MPELTEDRAELIARDQAKKGRNEAIAALGFFTILAALGVWGGLKGIAREEVEAVFENSRFAEIERSTERSWKLIAEMDKTTTHVLSELDARIVEMKSMGGFHAPGKVLGDESSGELKDPQEGEFKVLEVTVTTASGQVLLVLANAVVKARKGASAASEFSLRRGKQDLLLPGNVANQTQAMHTAAFADTPGEGEFVYSLWARIDGDVENCSARLQVVSLN